jgi:hypothetical protein
MRTLAVAAASFLPFLRNHPALRQAFIVYGRQHYIDLTAPEAEDDDSNKLFEEVAKSSHSQDIPSLQVRRLHQYLLDPLQCSLFSEIIIDINASAADILEVT